MEYLWQDTTLFGSLNFRCFGVFSPLANCFSEKRVVSRENIEFDDFRELSLKVLALSRAEI